MSTAFIFKHLLDVLKIESNLDGESSGEIGKDWLSPLLQSCAALRDAAVGKETSNKDRLVILPKVLKCYSRLLNKAVSIPLSEVKHPKLVETILKGLFNLLNTLHQADKEARLLLQKTTIDEQASVLMIFLHLITTFEAIGKKSSSSQPNEMEDEHLTEISLQVYNAILISVYMIHDDTISAEHFVNVEKHKLNHVFSGPLATQAVQSLLTFCNHKSKRIATFAAGNLLYTLRCFRQHRGVWRTCFPGSFSGLFVLTQSGYKSGSGLLSRVLSALLELTCLVTEDNTPENVQLLTYLYTPTAAAAAGNSTAVTANISGDNDAFLGTATSSSALFTNMLHKANTPSADTIDTPPIAVPNTCTSSVSVQATDQCLATEFSTVSEYVQWRVQVLQRIQLPLAAAFREVMKLCSPLQRVRQINQLGALLSNCSAILGSLCVSECLCELLNTMLDTTQIVRVTTQSVWYNVQASIKSSAYATNEYSKILDALGRKYFTLVNKLYGSVKLCQDARIKDQLGAILGIGYGIHEHIVNMVRLYGSSNNSVNTSNATSSGGNNSNSSIIKCISTLYMPDPAVCGVRVTASVLETRNYTYYTNEDTTNAGTFTNQSTLTQKALLLHSVESGYYRVAWRHVQDNICKEYADRWALYLGRYGLLEDVLATTSKQIDRYLQDTVFDGTSPAATEDVSAPSSSAVRALQTAGVVGCLRLLGTAVLGLASVSSVQTSSDSSDNNSNNKSNHGVKSSAVEVCGHCGRKNNTSSNSSNNTSMTSTAPPAAAAAAVSELPTTNKMLRCSRCKAVHYCNKQHQALDWPTHKLTCKSAEAAPPVTKSSTPVTTSDPSGTEEQPPLSSADLNVPIELLTNASIRIGATTIPHTLKTTTTTTSAAATATSVACVYSAAKKEYLIHRSVLLLLQIMQDYLFTRNTTTTTVAPTATSTANEHSPRHKQSVLVVAAAIEVIANIAFSAGPEGFQKYLMKLLYPLLELLVDSDPIVKQAAQCTLQRIALYTEHTSLSGLIRRNLDYIVDKICLQLRSASTNNIKKNVTYGNSGGNNASTHLIVDFVFSTLDTTVQASSTEISDNMDNSGDTALTAPMYLLRDVICDSLHSVDAYSLHSVYSTSQLTALLRVLRVLACRAAAAPTAREFVSGDGSDRNIMNSGSSDRGGGGMRVNSSSISDSGSLLKVSKHLQDKIFHKVKSTPVTPSNTTGNSSSSSADINTIVPPATAASFAAQSLLEFTRNLYNLNYEAADLTDTDATDPSADLLNADRIRAEKDRQNEQNIADEHEEEMNSTAVPTASVQLLLDVVHRCCVFLTLPHPVSQVIVIETLCAAFVRLSVHNVKYKHHLLPCIHSTWPVVVNRIHELVIVLRSTESHALHRALSTVKNGPGAGAKVKSGSSALLGLESSMSRISLTDPSCTSDVSVGNSSVGLTAVSSSSNTRGGTSLNTHYASNTITNSSSATGAHPSTIPLADQRTQLHVLPHVFDLVAILAVAGREFMTIKLKQELLPELYVLLTFYLQQSITSSQGGMNSGNKKATNIGAKAILDGAGPTKVLSRSQLLIASVNNNPTSSNNTDDHIDTSSTGEHVPIIRKDRTNDRHSLHSKVKLSVLSLLTQLCTASTIDVQIVKYMTTQVAPLVYLTLSLLSTPECDEVRAAAQGLLILLHKMDSAMTETFLRCVLDSKGAVAVATEMTGSPSTQQALQTWRALHYTPSIVAALHSNTSGITAGGVSAENVLHMYHNDSGLLKQLHGLLSSKTAGNESERKRDDYWSSLWMQKLALWSTV